MIGFVLAVAVAGSALGLHPDYDGFGWGDDDDRRGWAPSVKPTPIAPPPPVPNPVDVSGPADQVLRSNEPRLLAVLRGHTAPVRSAVFSTDGRQLLSASWDGTARLWDAATGKQLTSVAVPGDSKRGLQTAALSPDGSRLVTAGEDGVARVWEASSGGLVATLSGHNAQIDAAAYSGDGQRIVTGARDGTARLFDAASGRLLKTLNLGGHVSAVGLDREGLRVLTANSEGAAKLWDLQKASATSFGVSVPSYNRKLQWIGFVGDGLRVAVAGRSVEMFDAATGARLATFAEAFRPVSLSASADGRKLLGAADNGRVKLWNPTGGEVLLELTVGSSLYHGSISPDGSRVAVARSTWVEIWRVDYLPEEREAMRRALESQVSVPTGPGSAQNRFRRRP